MFHVVGMKTRLPKTRRGIGNNSDSSVLGVLLQYPFEGACRHLVKDRMERAGMRWSLEGAQAMLDLRSIHISGQWDEFTAHRIRKETAR